MKVHAPIRAARLAAAFVSPVDREAIFERDRWTCGICTGPVDPTLKYPDPWSVTIDHIEPLAAGGTHEPANVQTSHLRCNLRKGDGRLQSDRMEVYTHA